MGCSSRAPAPPAIEAGECTFRNAEIVGAKMTLWVNFCRTISRNARLLYLTKLPRRPFAIETVTGQFLPHAPAAKAASGSA
jgi:hypothetical protein